MKILFLDDTHSCRVIMAETLFREISGDQIEVTSAGVEAEGIHPEALTLLQEMGIHVPEKAPVSIDDLRPSSFDLVVTFGQKAHDCCCPSSAQDDSGDALHEALFLGSPALLHWSIEDPCQHLDRPDTFRQKVAQVKVRLEEQLEPLLRHGYLDALASQKRNIEMMVDSVDVGLMFLNSRARVYLFNTAAERITGRLRSDVLGRSCRQVFPPTGICADQCVFSAIRGCAKEKHEHIVSYRTPEGRERSLRIVLSPTKTASNRPCGVTAVISDITELGFGQWPGGKFHGLVGHSKALREVFITIRQAAQFDYPVLISGESGTGKELAARAIHAESKRNKGPFVPINCGALPENILESELFGHVRGAFTGAIRDKKGRFELADNGTLLLDEVGELSPSFQVKLLRVLQEKRFERVGGERQISVDVRVVSSTNKDLKELVKKGKFREDLFYRLCVVPINLPSLRTHREDLPSLVEHIIREIRRETGKQLRRVSAETMARLTAYPWPGNVRELINSLQYATIHCAGDEILPQHLPPEIRQWTTPAGIHHEKAVLVEDQPEIPEKSLAQPKESEGPKRGRQRLDKQRVIDALHQTSGNKVKAAALLGVGRATLYRFLNDNPLGSGTE